MFSYKLRINTNEMVASIVPYMEYIESGALILPSRGFRQITYKNFGQNIFFEIPVEDFPSYLRCEDFPWARLSNLNEILNFITMYEQYKLMTKTPAFLTLSGWGPPSLNVGLTCSCECSKDLPFVGSTSFRFEPQPLAFTYSEAPRLNLELAKTNMVEPKFFTTPFEFPYTGEPSARFGQILAVSMPLSQTITPISCSCKCSNEK